ncbi:HD domain-containing protein [Candidatus Electronema sp. PJ]|uniref:HD domain-containing protein n=1 Tax=Candidatus Electronema sp. PJ TaxID=3401572 RepID=UPI003AA9C559
MEGKKFDLEQYRRDMEALIGASPSVGLFYKALDFAAAAHEGQLRRSGDPYIMHPCATARILAEELEIRNAEILAAGLLHDTIEDVEEIVPAVIREKFGTTVEAIVVGCTKVKHHSGDKQALKKLVHRQLFTGAATRPEVMIVKIADRLHNLRTLDSMPRHKRQRIADETLDFYAPLATLLGLFGVKRELYNRALVNKFPKQGHKLQQQINRLKGNPALSNLTVKIEQSLNEAAVAAKVVVRTKGLWGYYDIKNRILRTEIEIPQEILITTANRISCYQILGILNEIFPPVPRTIRDFIANPKPTGYQGLHAKAIIDGGKYLFKIRTDEMAHSAQCGLVKDWNQANRKMDRFLKELQEMFDILGNDDAVSYRDMIAASGRKEIYTYTPDGDLICLPVHSAVLDFAFHIHTEIGHSCVGAMIGNQRVEPGDMLQDGSVVKILRQDTPVDFDLEMQTQCQTPRARSELAKAFRERIKHVAVSTGRAVLEQEMRRYGLPFDLIEHPGMENILLYFNITSRDELLQRVGQGRIQMRELIYEIRSGLLQSRDMLLQQPTGILNRIVLNTVDPVVVKSSACCRPTPLDRGLIGLLSTRGISLHCKDCFQLKKMKFQREDAVEVRWRLGATPVLKLQQFIVTDITAKYLFSRLAEGPEELHVMRVDRIEGDSSASFCAWEVHFTVANLLGLKKIIRHLDRSFLTYQFEFKH